MSSSAGAAAVVPAVSFIGYSLPTEGSKPGEILDDMIKHSANMEELTEVLQLLQSNMDKEMTQTQERYEKRRQPIIDVLAGRKAVTNVEEGAEGATNLAVSSSARGKEEFTGHVSRPSTTEDVDRNINNPLITNSPSSSQQSTPQSGGYNSPRKNTGISINDEVNARDRDKPVFSFLKRKASENSEGGGGLSSGFMNILPRDVDGVITLEKSLNRKTEGSNSSVGLSPNLFGPRKSSNVNSNEKEAGANSQQKNPRK